MLNDAPWVARAACAQVGGDWWFPDKGESPSVAKSYCQQCPVAAECLEYALTTGQDYGVWGGLTAEQRKELRRGRPSPYKMRAQALREQIRDLDRRGYAPTQIAVSLRVTERHVYRTIKGATS